MSNEIDISLFYFSGENQENVAMQLEQMQEVKKDEYNPDCFTLSDKKSVPKFLQKISEQIKDTEFFHIYAFVLANTTGYSIFKNGEILFQHIEGLAERLTQLKLHGIECENDDILLHYTYYHYKHELDFEEIPIEKKFIGRISKSLIVAPVDDFQSLIKNHLIFDEDQLNLLAIDALVIEKAYTLVVQKELDIHLNYQSLDKKLRLKEEESINKI